MIKYPLTVKGESHFVHLVDASDRVIAGGLSREDADEIVRALNARAAPKSRARKQKIEDDLRASDLMAQLTDRDNIEYGHHDSLPRGEHIARLRKDEA